MLVFEFVRAPLKLKDYASSRCVVDHVQRIFARNPDGLLHNSMIYISEKCLCSLDPWQVCKRW